MNDEKAILQLKNGDINGLEYLISKYQIKAVRAAFLVTRNKEMAEDVVQDSFVNLYKRIGQFNDSKPFEPYFMVCVMNAALSATIRGNRFQSFSQNFDESDFEKLLYRADSVESQVEQAQVRVDMLSLLTKLTPRQRAVVVQRYYLQMSEKEMTEASQTAPGTIKWLLNNARTRLRALIELGRNEE
ncbi:MAG: RNA polymerase subunit sigma-24 [Chloroflexi bacterium HGW-Chloroflexi-4]|jgi:RNA polymerase sigma-70 factor (ECF subfamily)|nr:MAG: RNA polymerase subunit sigma-24 [Chloroflexi bacterium HGW-Chloroflexi-4]